jgi:hypothetical protein
LPIAQAPQCTAVNRGSNPIDRAKSGSKRI